MERKKHTTETAIPAALEQNTTKVVPALWDQTETAKYLAVSPKWLERDRWQGATIPYIKIGRAVRYRAADVLDYLNRNTTDAA